MTISTDRTNIPVAIVGMACRLPGAANLNEYWKLISEGLSAVGEVPPERLNREIYYHPEKGVRGKTYSTKAALLDDRQFHADRCPIPQHLRDTVDNTHLLMTEVAAEAFRHAGYDPFHLPNRNVSVFIGHAQGSSRLGELTFQTYLDEAIALLEETPGFQDLPVSERQSIEQEVLNDLLKNIPGGSQEFRHLNCNMVAGTVARAFGLNGAWLALNSACASSLHAMLMGARALQRGRADAVVVGGASDCKSDSLVLFSNAQTLTKEDSRPFDSKADGLVMSEGYVALVMKTLDRAIADGDPIQAVVRGLGVATDGRGKSLWAPRKEGQIRAMRRAYRSGTDPSRLQYLECHATATQVGDATELETLGEVLGPKFPPGKKIPITSAKANIGHSLEAAGIAGMIKTVLCMQHRQYPAAINIQELNTKVPWDKSPFFVPMQPAAWEAPKDGGPRCAAVNAFGIGGLNMHVVIDEFVGQTTPQTTGSAAPIVEETVEDRAIAVIGMGCILPGADQLDRFWELVRSGTDPKGKPPTDRWSPQAWRIAAEAGFEPRGGFISNYAYDWRKHKVPPKQVLEADPLQFMFLDASEKALEDAGYDRDSIPREMTGVVVCTEFGGDFSDQLEMGLRLPEIQAHLGRHLKQKGLPASKIAEINQNFGTNLLKKWPALIDETGSFTSSTLASRISKTLDLKGGAVAIDSGVTSGMSGIALCIDSLLSGDNDLMICAAGQRRMGPMMYRGLMEAGILSAHGTAKDVWDPDYSGIIPGEGVGVVVLKRLADARRDGDNIRAVIRGIGIATDENPANAMRLAVERATTLAGIDPSEVDFIDVETDENATTSSPCYAALAQAHVSGNRQAPLNFASATAQFGQLGGGGPILALMKAVLQSQNKEVGPGLEIRTNPNKTPQATYRGVAKIRHHGRGGVATWSKGQAFYLLLDDGSRVPPQTKVAAPVAESLRAIPNGNVAPNSPSKIVRFGAASIAALKAELQSAVANSGSSWDTSDQRSFQSEDTARLAVVADSAASLAKKLTLAVDQLSNLASRQVLEQQGIYFRELPAVPPRVAFLFPGQGSQYQGMLSDLIAQSPAAAEMACQVDAAMRRQGFPTFAELAWNQPTQLGQDIWQTQIAMLLADLICLAAVQERGVTPDLVLGHSYGEFPALYAAGVWGLDEAIRLTKARCDGIEATALNNAGLLATNAPPDLVKSLISQNGIQAYLANFNAPDQTVIGGKKAALEQLSKRLTDASFAARILAVPAAFHTPLMAGSSRLLQQALETAELHSPRIHFISTVDNQRIEDVDRIRRNLGVQLTTSVQYVRLIEGLAEESPTVFVEVGPQQTLTKLNRKILSADANVIATDNPKRPGVDSILGVQALLECLGIGSAISPRSTNVKSPTAPQRAVISDPLTSSNEMNLMDDIPHFDATERRRMKMRGASDRPAGSAPVAPPQPSAPRQSAPNLQPSRLEPPASASRAYPQTPKSQPASESAQVPRPAFASQPASPPTAPPPPVDRPSVTNINGTNGQHANGSSAAPTSPPAVDLEKFLVNFVVEQTGYPPEVVDLDADLEADLGIDSIKKAQLFGELQEYFEISTSATELSLDDFSTLRHVVDFLSTSGQASDKRQPAAPSISTSASEVSHSVAAAPVQATGPATQPSPAAAPSKGASADELEKFLVNFVVEQTGYPPEVVDLDADLEADLGIDSIKKAQLFGELQEYFDINTSATDLSLDDFPTLRHVVNFLTASGQAQSEESAVPLQTPPAATDPPPPPSPGPTANGALKPSTHSATHAVLNGAASENHTSPAQDASPADLEKFLVNFVVEQTGYPPEVVDLDADLEADLGIDSIKKAQLFGELQEYFEISTSATELSLDDFATLRHVLNFLSASGQDASTAESTDEAASFSPAAPAPAWETNRIAPAVTPFSAEAGDADHFVTESESLATPSGVVGTPYQMGHQHGSQHRSEIRRILRTYAEFVGESIDELPGSDRCANALKLLSADQWDELQGIADAVEAPLANLLAHHFAVAEVLSDVDQLAAANQPSTQLRHAARIFPAAIGPLRDSLRLIPMLRKPHEGLPHVAVVPIGTVFVAGGINSRGVAVTWGGDSASNSRPASDPQLAELLANSADLEAALDHLGVKCDKLTGEFLLSDVDAGRIASVAVDQQGEQLISDAPIARLGRNQLSTVGGAEQRWSPEKAEVSQEDFADLFAPQDRDCLAWEFANQALILKGSLINETQERLSLRELFRLSGEPGKVSVRQSGTPLSAAKVTARFELEMRDAPLGSETPTAPHWRGAAILLGSGDMASALLAQLQHSGATVYQIADASDLDAVVARIESICQHGPAPHLFITTARDGNANVRFQDVDLWTQQQLTAVETPLFACQKWLAMAEAGGWLSEATVVATTALGGDFGFGQGASGGHGGGLTGLMKAIFIEYTVMRGGTGPRVKAFDTAPQDDPKSVAESILRELASGNLDYEVSWSGGVRRVPFAVDIPAERKATQQSLPRGTWLVTGGARGITAASALELGKRYGLRLHLLGASQLPQIDPAWRNLDAAGLQKLKADTMIAARKAGQSAPQAWEKVQKALEIDRSIRAFTEAGVSATYHACDVSSRESLAAVLDDIRRTDGPISGILHGAGIDKSCRMEKKRLDVVRPTIGAKAGGLVHLAALTKEDPIRHFVGFGSIAGRLGSFGQADYCMASDLLCKLMGTFRRERPWVRAVGFHWHGWAEVGMAARPETQSVLKDKSDLTLMPLAEGLGHLIREIEADVPRNEVLITERRHWRRFAEGLGQRTEDRKVPAATSSEPVPEKDLHTPVEAKGSISVSQEPLGPPDPTVELRTERCEMKLMDAPLPSGSPPIPTFDAPVWIVGENADAVELENRVKAAGAEVYRFGVGEDLDATLARLAELHPQQAAKHLFLLSGRDETPADPLSAEAIEHRSREGIVSPFFIAQHWYNRLSKAGVGTGTLVAAVSLGGDFGFDSTVVNPDGGGTAGFVKSIHIEDSRRDPRIARCKVIDAPATDSAATLVDALLCEAAADRPEVEVSWCHGVRRVVRPIPVALPPGPAANIPRGGTWIVTGGARGITAIAARELAAKYGWRVHLLGKSPPPLKDAPWREFDQEQLRTYKTQITRDAVTRGQSPGAAWDRVLKDCEIFENLRKFAEAGVDATYHQCDVTSRKELDATLQTIRQADGGINGLMHGAGLIEPGRFENKRRNFVEKLVRTKFDGLLHLLALTKNDPLTHCIGFGSISGRFGGNGLSDYAAGNDSMSKVLDWHRKVRPDCTTLCIHWESWEGAGIATLSRFAWGPRSVMKMKYMLPEEGVRRLEEELAGGGKNAETLYTFGDFYPMFYPQEQYPLGEYQPQSGTRAEMPLVRTTRFDGDELVGDVPLDPVHDPFLALHRLRDKPLMPVVATLEALREATVIATGKQVTAFRDVNMVDGLLFHTENPQTAQARATVLGDDLALCRWTCDFRNRSGGLIQKDRLYLEAKAAVADAPARLSFEPPPFPTKWDAVEYPNDSAIYHGPPFRCLKAIACEPATGWGHILAQPLADLTGETKRDGWIMPSCVLDSALYACGCHLYLHSNGAVSLPRKIQLLELGRPAVDGENCYVNFACREIADKSALYDLTVVGEDGTVILKATGYEKVILSRGDIA